MTENKGDLISREALKEKIWRSDVSTREKISNLIDNAPTVEVIPTELHEKIMDKTTGELLECQSNLRPQGEWIEDKVAFHLVCNQCGCTLRQLKSEVFEGDYDYNFCPNCGASMKPKANQLRDCENCVHHSDNGCEVWKCEFKRRSS